MKEYPKMSDRFSGHVKQEESCERQMLIDDESYYADIFSDGDYIAHAINSHDELVAEVERLNLQVEDLLRCVDTAVTNGDFSPIYGARKKYITD
jgi:hypothetical protein